MTQEIRLRTEDRKLQLAIEEQSGTSSTLPALETFLKDMRGNPHSSTSTVILDTHELKGSEPHMFALADNRFLLSNSFYFRVTIPMKAVRSDDVMMQDIITELPPEERR